MKSLIRLLNPTCVCAAALAIALPVVAQTTDTWNGSVDANWSTAGNWSPGAPSSGDNLVFAGTANTTANNDFTANTAFGSIIFDPTAGGFDLIGNEINFGSLIQNNSSTAQAIDLSLLLTNAVTVDTAAGDISIGLNAGGMLGTSTSLTKIGTGTLTLSNANFSGGMTVSNGQLVLKTDNPNGGFTYTNAGASILLTYGSWNSPRNFAFTADGSLGVQIGDKLYSDRGRYDCNGNVGSPGFKWTVIGDGRFQILGHVTAGSVEVTAPAVLGALANGNANITGLGTNTITVDNGAALRINNGGIVLAPIVLAGGSGPDNQGALVANQEGYSGLGSVATATFSNTITLLNDTSFGAQTSAGNSFPATLAIPGNITGSGGLQKIGPNLMSLSGSNSYAGNTTIGNSGTVNSGGTLRLASSNALPATTSLTINENSILDLNGNAATVISLSDDGLGFATVDNTSTNPAVLTISSSGTFFGTIQNSGGGALSLVNVGGSTYLYHSIKYTGATLVEGGSVFMVLPSANTIGGLVLATNNATLSLQFPTPGASLPASGVTLGNSGADNTYLTVDLNSYGNVANPVINATNGTGVLAANGTINVTINNPANMIVGAVHLIKYTTFSGSGSFVLNDISGVGAYITNNLSAKSIDIVVTNAPITTWTARINTNWDYTTTNWIYAGIKTNYQDSEGIFFDDTASNFLVNLAITPSPSSILVNAANTYLFTGSNPLSGGTLTKNGAGTLILDVSGNSYASTTISAGTLQVGNNDGSGDLGSGAVNDQATLSFVRSNALTVANTISGAGSVVQNDTNTTTISAANTYAGGTTIKQGVLRLGNVAALGSPSVSAPLATISSGAALDINGQQNGPTPTNAVIISGPGVATNQGAIFNSGGGSWHYGPEIGIQTVQLANDASIGNDGGLWYVGWNSVGGIVGNGYKLTKIGNNTIEIRASSPSPLSQFVVAGGGVQIWKANPFGSTTTVVLTNNASINTWDQSSWTGFTINNNFIIANNGGQINNSIGSDYNHGDYDTYTGSITLNGTLSVAVSSQFGSAANQGKTTISGPMSGVGGLVKSGPYLLTLSGANTYTGNTTISAGTLAISAISQGGGAYTNMDGATLNVPSQTGYSTVPMSSLALGSTNGSTFALSRVTSFDMSHAPITATNLVLVGTNSVLLPPLAYAGTPGEYPLIKYGAVSGSGIVAIGGGVRGVPGYITNDTANSQIALVIPGGTPVVWTGSVNTNWDINTTSNWQTNGVATTYQQLGALGDAVTFDDSSAVTNVYLASSVSPTMIIVNNSNKLYSFTGSIITNATSLLKQGTNTLFLNNGANTFSGGTVVSGGTIKLGNDGSLNNGSGSASQVTVKNGGTVDLNGYNPQYVTFTISGAGVGGNGAIVANANGAYNKCPGAVVLAGDATIGSATRWDLRNGLNRLDTPTNAYTLTKVGADQIAFVSTTISTNLGDVKVLAGTLGYQLNTPSMGDPAKSLFIATNAILNFYQAAVPLNKQIVCSNGASITMQSGGGVSGNPYLGLAPTTQNIISGPIYLPGPNGASAPADINCNYYNGCAISNTISGPGGLKFDYNAYNRLYAPNTYTGDSQILGGVYLYANSCIVSTNSIYINVGPLYVTNNAFAGVSSTFLNDNLGGVFLAGNGSVNFAKMQIGGGGNQGYMDASARTDGTFTLPNNSLVYSGSAANNYIKGNLVVTPGSTLSVGSAGSVQVLSCSNNVTFQAGSTNYVDVNKTATVTNCDLLNVTGTINYGGVLRIQTNGTVALLAGDTFKLVNAGGNTGNFASIVDPSGATWSFNPTTGVATVVTPPPTVSLTPTNIFTSVSGNQLTMQWPLDHTGWTLQSNSISLMNTGAWFAVPGSTTTNKIIITLNPALTNVFYRMKY